MAVTTTAVTTTTLCTAVFQDLGIHDGWLSRILSPSRLRARCLATLKLVCRSFVCFISASAMPLLFWVEITEYLSSRWATRETHNFATPTAVAHDVVKQ